MLEYLTDETNMSCYPCRNKIPNCFNCYNSTICLHCNYPYALNDNYECIKCDQNSNNIIYKKIFSFTLFLTN